MKKFVNILVAVIVAAVFAGCEGKEDPAPETAVASIVTYIETSGEVSTFTYTDNQENLITLTAAWSGNEELTPGRRVLIYYRAETYGVSGQITLLSVVPLSGGAPKIAAEADIPRSVELKECAIWRSGNFLNLSAVVTFGGDAKAISLYIEEETAALQVPTARVVVESDYANLGAERSLYASWDLTDVFTASNFEGLNVIYMDSSNQEKTIKITK